MATKDDSVPVADVTAAVRSEALAKAAAEAEARQADEAPDGPRYLVGGELVDADGQPVKQAKGEGK